MAAAKDEAATKTLVVFDNKGKFTVTIPADWKVTFGLPRGNNGAGYGGADRELRVYEAETKQRACFTNVISFFDTSLPIFREVVQENGSTTWEQDENGSTSTKTVARKRTQKEGYA